MNQFRYLFRQVFTVPRIARQLSKDEAFIRESGLDEIPGSRRAAALSQRVGFVLAMRDTLQSAIARMPDANDDERLVALVASRLRLPEPTSPSVKSTESVLSPAVAVVQMISEHEPKWHTMMLSGKFCLVCGFMMDVEQRKLAKRFPSQNHND